MREDWHCGGKEVYKWIKGSSPPAVNCVKHQDGAITFGKNKVLDSLDRAWSPIYNVHRDHPSDWWEDFRLEYAVEIKQLAEAAGKDVDLPISGNRLWTHIHDDTNFDSAAGTDHWTIAELKKLPVYLIDALADLLAVCEKHGWPAAFLYAIIAMLPKDSSGEPLKHRPISILVLILRIWSSIRFRDSLAWQERCCLLYTSPSPRD